MTNYEIEVQNTSTGKVDTITVSSRHQANVVAAIKRPLGCLVNWVKEVGGRDILYTDRQINY